MNEALRFEGVTVEYRSRLGRRQNILADVSFTIGAGEALGLVGESGCGKSTVALAAMGYLPRGIAVTAGRVLVDGRDIATLAPRELQAIRGNRVAMVYQDPMSSLNPVMTIGAQLIEVPMLHGERSREAARRRAIRMLDEVRLPDPEAAMLRYPHQLSGGQQQRVVIAMALMSEPALLLMDEPTTGLDVTIEAAILELVRDLRRRFGAAILFISHNLGTVARICERIGVLYAGRLIETGPIGTVFREPAHPYTRGLLGALPRLDGRGRRGHLTPIEGNIAARDRARIGCAFLPRCAVAAPALCAPSPIALDPVPGSAADHLARCVRLDARPDAEPIEVGEIAEADDEAPVLLDIRNLEKNFDVGGGFGTGKRRVVRALSDVSLAAREGRTLAIVGESGCGKSTLARVVAGLFPATGGQAELGGEDLASRAVDRRPADLRRRIQMVFQNPDSTLNPSHSVEYALTRPLMSLRGLSRSAARAEVPRLMERVRLSPELRHRMPDQLSGGQRQRVAIARALAGEPDLVIADEPVSALDVSVQAAILNLLNDLLDRSAIGLVIISHDLALVRHMADWVAVMYLGRVVEYGPADQVFRPPWHPYTEALLAAAPTPDPEAPTPTTILGGAMPSASAVIMGCAFAGRCPREIEGVCATTPPPTRRLGPHLILCHHETATVAAAAQ
jgi:peptide/nickel transport system ATP-binding protein